MVFRAFALLLWVGGMSSLSLQAQQLPSAADNLAAGVRQVRSGDFFRAVLTLNEAVSQLATEQSAGGTLAKAHAYRAMAYIGLDQPERARAAVLLALNADPKVAIGAGEFNPAVVALFADARHPSASDPEAAGRAAEQGGRLQLAFLSYLTAYHALPDPPPAADDRRLREKIIKVVAQLGTAPVVPPDARARVTKADQLLEAEAILGSSAGSSSQAAAELRRAVRAAPWWADATFKLAIVLQRLQQSEEALLNLNLYRLADPDGYAATVARATANAPSELAARVVVPKTIGPAVIYVYWPPQVRGGGRPKVYCDANRVADLNDRHYVRLSAPAGMHTLKFHNTSFPIGVDGGQTYYVRASAEGFPARAALRLVAPEEAIAEMKAKNIELNDPKKTYNAGCSAPLRQGQQ